MSTKINDDFLKLLKPVQPLSEIELARLEKLKKQAEKK
jgi:hypothetical protein